MSRAVPSAGPPAAKLTTMEMGRDGQDDADCAARGPVTKAMAAATSRTSTASRLMALPLAFLPTFSSADRWRQINAAAVLWQAPRDTLATERVGRMIRDGEGNGAGGCRRMRSRAVG